MSDESLTERPAESEEWRGEVASESGVEGERSTVTKPELGEPVVDAGPVESARTWLVLIGHRLLVSAVFLLGVLALLAAVDATLGLIDPAEPMPIYYVFGGLIGGNFTLITIVISINQLVISQQIGPPGELRDQIQATNAYREAVEESVEVPVAPVTPTEFLHLLLRSTADAVETIREEAGEGTEGEPRDQLLAVTDDIYEHVEHVESLLGRPEVSVFQALAAALDTNYSQEMYRLRRLRNQYGRNYPDTVVECLDDLVVRLQQIDVARQYLNSTRLMRGTY